MMYVVNVDFASQSFNCEISVARYVNRTQKTPGLAELIFSLSFDGRSSARNLINRLLTFAPNCRTQNANKETYRTKKHADEAC